MQIGERLREVSDLYRVCTALRRGYLRSHPEEPESPSEREYREAIEYVKAHREPAV
jgi:hypothetical protein